MLQRGFTLVEVIISVAVVGVLAAIAAPQYQARIAKTQVSEAISSLGAEKEVVIANIIKKGDCVGDNTIKSLKYGTLAVNGKLVGDALSHPHSQIKTGCSLTYTFANSGVSKRLQGKKLTVDVFSNGVLSKSTNTNLETNLIPPSLSTLTEDTLVKNEITVGSTVDVAKDSEEILPELAGDSLEYYNIKAIKSGVFGYGVGSLGDGAYAILFFQGYMANDKLSFGYIDDTALENTGKKYVSRRPFSYLTTTPTQMNGWTGYKFKTFEFEVQDFKLGESEFRLEHIGTYSPGDGMGASGYPYQHSLIATIITTSGPKPDSFWVNLNDNIVEFKTANSISACYNRKLCSNIKNFHQEKNYTNIDRNSEEFKGFYSEVLKDAPSKFIIGLTKESVTR